MAALDKGDDWKKDKSCWVKPNPNLGVSIQPKYLQEQVTEAVQIPAKENIVARLNFCVWTDASTRAISTEDWLACGREFTIKDLEGQDCFAGLDLSSTTDLTAWVLLFPYWDDEGLTHYRILPTVWIPELRVQALEDRDRVPYRMWIRQGHLLTTPGNIVDYDFIRERIIADSERFNIQEVAYDPWNCRETAAEAAKRRLQDGGAAAGRTNDVRAHQKASGADSGSPD